MKCKNCGLTIEPLKGSSHWMHNDARRPWSERGWVCDPTNDKSTHAEPEVSRDDWSKAGC